MDGPSEVRYLKLSIHKNAYGKPDYARLTIPVRWIRELGISDSTEVRASFIPSEGKIVVYLTNSRNSANV